MDAALPDSSLRLELDTIAHDHSAHGVRTQIGEIERLRQRFHHSIELSLAVDDASSGPGQYTCFMHALELAPPPQLVAAIVARFDTIFPGADFVAHLVRLRWLIAATEPGDGDILIYFDGDRPKHAGKLASGRVESKWGLGHTWLHPEFEIPSSYGNRLEAFQRVDRRTATEWFVQFAESKAGTGAIASLRRPDA